MICEPARLAPQTSNPAVSTVACADARQQAGTEWSDPVAERPIRVFGDPVLKAVSLPVEQIDEGVRGLVADLVDSVRLPGRAGVAAPQIGVSQRVIVMDCGEGLIELINPEILEFNGEQIGPEACLSLPGYSGIVPRANYVLVKTLDREGHSIQIEAREFLARCMQHEIDHLNGILYIDHIKDDLLYEEGAEQKADLAAILRHSKKGT